MAQYRKKPVVIEAWQWKGFLADLPDDVTRSSYIDATTRGRDEGSQHPLIISTLEGNMRADPGDWIIRGVKGELYPCKPDIFAATYDEVVVRLEKPTLAELERMLEEPMTKANIHPDGSVTIER